MSIDDDLTDIFKKDQGGDPLGVYRFVLEVYLNFHTVTEGNLPLTCTLATIYLTAAMRANKQTGTE